MLEDTSSLDGAQMKVNKCLLLVFQVLVFQNYDPDGLKTITKISQTLLIQTVKLNITNCRSRQSYCKCSFKVTLFDLIASNDFFFFGNQVMCDAPVAENRH